MSERNRVFTRGTVCSTEEEVFEQRFDLMNSPRKPRNTSRTPPGRFFTDYTGSDIPLSSESWATREANLLGKKPVVLKIEVGRDNFSTVEGRMHTIIHGGSGDWEEYDYEPVPTYDDIKIGSGVAIDLAGMKPEELVALKAEVGFKDEEGKFKYRKVSLEDFR